LSAAQFTAPQPSRGAFTGLLALLAGLGRAVRLPFDAILAGMVSAGVCIETLCEVLELTRSGLDDHVIRLGLRSPSDKTARRRSARSWSTADEQKALVWRAAGVHPEAIGANLTKQRSPNAVRTKLRRMGQARPPRKELFRPDPAFFTAFSTDWASPFDTAAPSRPADNCGRAAGPANVRGAQATPATVAVAGVEASSPIPVTSQSSGRPAPGSAVAALDPAKRATGSADAKGRNQARRATGDGQREFGFFSGVGGSERAHTVTVRGKVTGASPQQGVERPPSVLKPIPATCEAVDFSDLSWIASVKRPLTHKPTVHAIGTLVMSGVDYRAAAKLVGKTVASFRTLRTRMGVPVDRDRRKVVQVFDPHVASATKDRGGWIVAKSLNTEDYRGPPLYFWKRQADRNTHLSPVLRKHDPMFARQSPEMTIVTRQELEAQGRLGLASKMPAFANISVRIGA
jgi:hypothetical protein